MAGITLEQCEAQLAALLAASLALTTGTLVEVEVFGKKIKKNDLSTLNDSIEWWDNKCKQLAAKGSRTGRRTRGVTIT